MKIHQKYFNFISFGIIFAAVSVVAAIIKPEPFWVVIWLIAGFLGIYLSGWHSKVNDRFLETKVREEIEKQLKERDL